MARKYQWMGRIALFLVVLLLSDSMLVRAMESGVIIGDGISEDVEAYEIDEDKIWAQIDRNELRSLVDAEELKNTIDTQELLAKIDKTAIEQNISDIYLLDSLDSEAILADYNEKKASGELDKLIKDVIESEDFDEDFILNHPVDIPNVVIPIVQGNSPFDYILDPQGLVYQTDAARYGGGNVKENANVLFRNSEGEYAFSDLSDKLNITNKSNIPLQVTISARIEDAGNVAMVDSISDLHGLEPSMFMALVDDEGIISVLNSSGSSEINIVLKAAPEGTYVYKLNEETGEYEYELADRAYSGNSSGKEKIIIEQSNDASLPQANDNKDEVIISEKSEDKAEEVTAPEEREDKVEKVTAPEGREDKVEKVTAPEESDNKSEEASNHEASGEQKEEGSIEVKKDEVSVDIKENYADNTRQSITRMMVRTNSEGEGSSKTDDHGFDSFTFGLFASCNTEADWTEATGLPRVVVSWKTEPILTDWDKINEELEAYEKVKFEAYKRVRLEELRKNEIQRLVQEELEDLIEIKLEELIEAKVDILAKEKYDELVLKAIAAETVFYSDTERAYDGEDVLVISDDADQAAVEQTPVIVTPSIPGTVIKENSTESSETVTQEPAADESETLIISSLPQEEAVTEATDSVVIDEAEPENEPEDVEQSDQG